VELTCFNIKKIVRCFIISLMKCTPSFVIMVNGHLNLVKIYSYKNLTIITTILVECLCLYPFCCMSIATKIYLFFISLPIGLNGPIKCRPHFIKGSSRNVVINLARFLFLVVHSFESCHNLCKSFEYP